MYWVGGVGINIFASRKKASCTWGYTEVRANFIVYLQEIQLYLSNTMMLMQHVLKALANFPSSSGYFPLKSQLDFFMTYCFLVVTGLKKFSSFIPFSQATWGNTRRETWETRNCRGIFFAKYGPFFHIQDKQIEPGLQLETSARMSILQSEPDCQT